MKKLTLSHEKHRLTMLTKMFRMHYDFYYEKEILKNLIYNQPKQETTSDLYGNWDYTYYLFNSYTVQNNL